MYGHVRLCMGYFGHSFISSCDLRASLSSSDHVFLTSGEKTNVFELHNLTAPSFGQHSHYLLRHSVNNVVTYIMHGYGVE